MSVNYLYAAYNHYGDLIADGYSIRGIESKCWKLGYDEDEYFIARVSA